MMNKLLAWCNEPLRDHLLGVAENSRKLASALKLNMEKQAFLAGLLHDIGKADDGAQNRLKGCIGAGGHEIVSYIVAYNLLKELISPEDRYIILIAILRHHQAMARLSERLEQAKQWFSGHVPAQELESIINEGFAQLGYKLPAGQLLWPKKGYLEVMIHEVQKDIHSFIEDSDILLRASLRARMLSAIVMASDTYVAMIRGGETGLYGEEIKYLFKIYTQLLGDH
ncbi:MAG: CRISPR-associated endonuclease Cas3'' [Thermoproteota archaeon]|jgi:CRISPR-associated endonuclease Cas3-HD|uniref:CRISPR-associated endonuclease Cas3 n=1 Tax=Candidatus Methanodesulfokora washburnensis TaxID=2478471 RepID=A0A3R9PEX2_9CREN|nr:CRISPR-associated endonuclease Cas3'' [Candidatus Methanodesulfokores washburnensis]RSN72536.1 CRISPR-associated endonuclease Cas3'' [Candidatus Methanodesulfokores washburnensis]TDA40740.1 MAG: CRISPR-associated endonuclease Cas3'' [Candidatus Korarchaeota archaeon]